MNLLKDGAVSLTVVAALVAAVFSLGFTAGGHMLNTSIHQDIPTKSALINSAVDRHAAVPHKGMVSREEYVISLNAIQQDIRDIRLMLEARVQ